MCTSGRMHMEAGRQHCLVFQTGSLTGREVHLYQVRLVYQLAPEIPILNPQPHHIELLCRHWGANAGSHACTARAFSTQPPQQAPQTPSLLSSYPLHIVFQQ